LSDYRLLIVGFVGGILVLTVLGFVYPLFGCGVAVGGGVVLGLVVWLLPIYNRWVLVRKRKRFLELQVEVKRLEAELSK